MLVKLEDSLLTSIADAIRDQNEESSVYLVQEMPTKIRDLIWQGTQEEYEEIEEPNPSTLYIIVEEEE